VITNSLVFDFAALFWSLSFSRPSFSADLRKVVRDLWEEFFISIGVVLALMFGEEGGGMNGRLGRM